MPDLGTLVERLIAAVFAELFTVWFLLGVILLLIGFALLALGVYVRLIGRRTTGSVVGAVKKVRTKEKVRDGKTITKIKRTLYPVFEYPDAEGNLRRTLGSEGGSGTLRYRTGQTVNLLISPTAHYDDVYDADNRGVFWFGLGFVAVGLALMVQIGSFLSAVGVGALTLGMVSIGLIGRAIIERPGKERKSGRRAVDAHKAFAPDEVTPVEFFVEQRRRNK